MALKFPKNRTLFTKDSILTFGKYEGETVLDVIKKNAGYILWCIDEIDWFDVTTEIADLAREYYEDRLWDYSYGNPCDSYNTESYLDALCGEGAWGW